MQVDGSFAGAEVLDTRGGRHALETLWGEQAAVLVFVRHFGCMFCRALVTELKAAHGEFVELGGALYVIGNGSVAQAQAFEKEQGAPFKIFTDPSLKSYALAGFHHKRGIGIGTFKRARDTLKGGHRQGRVQGDPKQQGGALIILPGGDRVWSHVDRFAGDTANVKQMLSALRLSDNGLGGIDPSKD